MSGTVTAYIGLGSNLEDPVQQVRRALKELSQLDQSRLVACSSLYRSDPVGPPGQPDYINAVAALETGMEALALLDALQGLEQLHRRVRKERWGPRTLDLDILMFADAIIEHPRLTVPHCRIAERSFVCQPWLEIAPDLTVPGMGRLDRLAAALGTGGLERLDEQR